MTPEQQRIAIAESVGWDWKETSETPFGALQPICSWFNPQGKRAAFIPDFLNDLNAMHEVEKTIDRGPRRLSYVDNLVICCGIYTSKNLNCAIMATAAQRAEAYLKTIGKWQEQKKYKLPETGLPDPENQATPSGNESRQTREAMSDQAKEPSQWAKDAAKRCLDWVLTDADYDELTKQEMQDCVRFIQSAFDAATAEKDLRIESLYETLNARDRAIAELQKEIAELKSGWAFTRKKDQRIAELEKECGEWARQVVLKDREIEKLKAQIEEMEKWL